MIGSESEWHHRAVCNHCGWHTYAPFADLFHVHRECCPRCGADKTADNFTIKKMRRGPSKTCLGPHVWETCTQPTGGE